MGVDVHACGAAYPQPEVFLLLPQAITVLQAVLVGMTPPPPRPLKSPTLARGDGLLVGGGGLQGVGDFKGGINGRF